ncbi:hypothetical protein, partial [Lacticaseibacillus paracasei]|uniref:hypothetical protein n=1 Tax=Lacticaseibacillus paracasei TaxID=1597 RepID=UPI003D067CEA
WGEYERELPLMFHDQAGSAWSGFGATAPEGLKLAFFLPVSSYLDTYRNNKFFQNCLYPLT